MGEHIKLEKLRHVFKAPEGGEYVALENIDLAIQPGEFIAIIGTNGCGKSTLAKHLNALLLPTAGNCYINGLNTRDSQNLWQIRQTVGMVFQNPDNQIVAAIVEEDVAFGPENLGVAPAEIRSRVDEALEQVGMAEYRHHAPHLLSGGQKQRIAIAGVLALRSECVVLDEPTAMLDPQGRKEVLATVRRLHRDAGKTIVYITHFMEEAAVADRVVVMERGKIAFSGPPGVVFSQVDKLKQIGLDVPLAADLAHRLRQKGLDLSPQIIDEKQLAVALCP